MRHVALLLLGVLACSKKGEAVATGAPAESAMADSTAEDAEPWMKSPETPRVALTGAHSPPAALEDGVPRIGAKIWSVRVYKTPSRGATLLGALRGGLGVATTTRTAAATPECKGGWQGVRPGGWVCLDDMTTDLAHPILKAVSRGPDFAAKLPYMYGTVMRGGPVYSRIPTEAQLREHEPNLDTHLKKWREDEESGASYGLDVWLRYEKAKEGDALALLESRTTDDDIPEFLANNRPAPNLSGTIPSSDLVRVGQVDRKQGRSFIDTFLVDGRRYNLTPDLVVIPADRFRPIRGSEFHGWAVDADGLKPPFAIIRREGARRFAWDEKKKRLVDDGPIAYRTFLKLTGEQKFKQGLYYFETTEGFYVTDRHASRIDPAKRWPKWAQDGEKWIDINLTKQVLVAYEGTKMVYATLVSSGEDGLADPEVAKKATIRGIYRIHTKWVTNTMDSRESGEEFELRDVPYVQYFKEGYALHAAYWHDKFGTPKSHGCINLAPEDARRLFFWTEPSVPDGWHGAMKALTGTILFIHP